MAAEVEDSYAIEVDVVVVGDVQVNDQLAALVGASREALVNAAKHAEVTSVSLYAEVEADAVTAFVKDRGVGFDIDSIGDDRQGVRHRESAQQQGKRHRSADQHAKIVSR